MAPARPGEWKGDFNTTMIAIVTVVCFSWVPVVIVVSIYQHLRARSRAKKDSAKDAADLANAPPRKPYVPMKQPEYVPMPVVPRPASIRTFNSSSSWSPTKRDWRDAASISYEPPFSSPADSLGPSPRRASRTSFQINNAFYDTTPLPENAPMIKAAYAKSEAGRSQRRSTEQRRSMEAGPSRSSSRSRPSAELDPTSDEYPPPMPSLPPSALLAEPGPRQQPESDGNSPRSATRPLKGILVSRRDESPPPPVPSVPLSLSRPRGNATPADPRTRRPSLSPPTVAQTQTVATISPFDDLAEIPATRTHAFEALDFGISQPQRTSLRSQTSQESLQNGEEMNEMYVAQAL